MQINTSAAPPVIPTGTIDCTAGISSPCTPDFPIVSSRQGQGYSAIDLGNNTSNVVVSVEPQQAPQSLRLSLLNGPFPDGQSVIGLNLNADLSSSTLTSNAGNFIIIGDNFLSLNVKLDGYGQPGQSLSGLNASQICAQKVKASTYGADTLSNFTNLRLSNPSLPQNACVIDDINFMQSSKFACDPGYNEVVTINSVYTVPVLEIPKISRCQTTLSYDVCVRKKIQLACNWTVFRNDGTNPDGSINYTTMPYGTTVTRVMPEDQFYYLRGIMNDADLCNTHVAQEISDPTYVPQGVASNFTGDANPGNSIITNAFSFKGNTTLGSTVITFTSIPSSLSVGQSIIGNGVLANTTILQIGSGSITISAAATVTDTNVNFLTGLAVGQTLILSPNASTTTLVLASTFTGNINPGDPTISNAISFQGDTTNGGSTIAFNSIPSSVAVGQSIVGNGIPSNTTITAIDSGSVTISQSATADATAVNFLTGVSIGQVLGSSVTTNVPVSNFTGDAILGDTTITNAFTFQGNTIAGNTTVSFTTIPTSVVVGQPIIGNGIQDNTTITQIGPTSLTMSQTASLTSVTPVNLLTGLSIGQTLSLTGVITAGTTITGFSAATVNVSNSIISGTTSAPFQTFSQLTSTIFPSGTTVTGISGQNISISSPMTGTTAISSASFQSFSQVVVASTLSSAIPSGTKIIAISPSVINISNSVSGSKAVLAGSFQSLSQNNVVNPLTDNANAKSGCSPTNPCLWRESGLTAVLSTPGLDPAVGDQLLPGSNWDLSNTALNEHCNASTNPQTGFWSTIKTVTTNYVAFDPVDTTCKQTDIVTYSNGNKVIQYPAIAIDPNMKASWFYTGVAQEPDFGTQPLQCDLGNCPVNSVVSDLSQSLDSITPGNGQAGTQQGAGLILIYDTQSLTVESKIGQAGSGGQNDIINTPAQKVCVKVLDAATQGINSTYARDPMVQFNRYTWTAVKTSVSGSPGQQPVNNGNGVVIWKKLDSSVRYYLQSYLFSQ